MDTLTQVERSKRMSLIRSKNTKPERLVRRLVTGLGYRYRLHSRNLPGHPDLAFSGKRKVIFVHGCFWHIHAGCKNNRPPKSRLKFWLPKLKGNRKRDTENQRKLRQLGWKVMVIWECELARLTTAERHIAKFLRDDK
jgi:DNA mismatch endonuclease (patch repair protein)